MTNVLVALARLFGGNFGLAIIAFTIIMRIVTWPLLSSQYKTTRIMQQIQPQLRELEKKYKGKDPKKFQQEMLALYREHGFNPLGCFFPLLVQFPIWIALYAVISRSLGDTPESFVTLSQSLYPIPYVRDAVPFETSFLIWDLGERDTLLLPILVGVTMYVQQKMITPAPAATANRQQMQQQQTQQMMTWMMPLMFFFWTSTAPSGLGLYWFVTNLVGIITQYFYLGRRLDWRNIFSLGMPQAPTPAARPNRPQQQAAASKAADKKQPAGPEADEGDGAEDATDAAPSGGGGRDRRRKRHGRRRGKR
jgi:YidC/Oxa1 family membrane protein insertase